MNNRSSFIFRYCLLSILCIALLASTSCRKTSNEQYVESSLLQEDSLRLGLYCSSDYGEIGSRSYALILHDDSYRLVCRLRKGALLSDFSGEYTIKKTDGVFPGKSLYTKDPQGRDFIDFYLMDYEPPHLSIEISPRALETDENGVPQKPRPDPYFTLVYMPDVDIDKLMNLSTDELYEYLCDLKGVPQ